jgi:hypothetical protein
MQTVVSIMPFSFQDNKPGLTPGDFQMPAGSLDEPATLVIRKAQIRQMDQNFKYFPMDVDLALVAADVCDGYAQAQIGFDHDARPGMFYVPGEIIDDEHGTAAEKIKRLFPKKLQEAEEKQRTWFRSLVKMADDEWAIRPQHRNISDLSRHAARYLNIERAWLSTDMNESMRCPACMSVVSNQAAVCFACKAVLNAEAYARIQFAGQPPVATQGVKEEKVASTPVEKVPVSSKPVA